MKLNVYSLFCDDVLESDVVVSSPVLPTALERPVVTLVTRTRLSERWHLYVVGEGRLEVVAVQVLTYKQYYNSTCCNPFLEWLAWFIKKSKQFNQS